MFAPRTILTTLYSAALLLLWQETYGQSLFWAQNTGRGSYAQVGKYVAADASGNAYHTGRFTGWTDFDPGIGTYVLTSSGYDWDAYISKIGPTGNLIWAAKFGSSDNDIGQSVCIDPYGNILCSGTFSGTVDFDPGPGTFNLSCPLGVRNCFLVKLQPNGTLIFAINIGGPGHDEARSVTTDASGNIFVAGYFNQTVDFDPSTSVYNVTANGSLQDMFVVKLDPAGNFSSVFTAGSASQLDQAESLTADNFGNIYVTGEFSSTANFNPSGTIAITANGLTDVFMIKLDNSLNIIWAKSFGGTAYDEGYSIAWSPHNHLAVCGSFQNTMTITGATVSNLNALGVQDIFVGLFDTSGIALWANGYGSSGNFYESGKSVAFDLYGNIFLGGFFSTAVNFDPLFSNTTLVANGGSGMDGFICKLDTLNDFKYVSGFGSAGNDELHGICFDPSGSLYGTGCFSLTADFDPGIGTYNLTSMATVDAFLMKLAVVEILLSADLVYFHAELIQDNVNLDWKTASEFRNERFVIERSPDGFNWKDIGQVEGTGSSTVPVTYRFEDVQPFQGRNYYRLRQIDYDGNFTRSTVRSVKTGHSTSVVLYPNPVTGEFCYLTLNESVTKIGIYDLNGILLRQETPLDIEAPGNYRIDVSGLAAGVYMIKFKSITTEGVELLTIAE